MLTVKIYNRNVSSTLGRGTGCKIANAFMLMKMLHASEVDSELISRHFYIRQTNGQLFVKGSVQLQWQKVLYSK